MTKRNDHHLTIYRRHAPKCSLNGKPRVLDGCQCPLYYHGKLHGKFVREALNTRSHITAALKVQDLLDGRGPSPDGPNGGLALIASAPQGDVTLEFAASDFLAAKGRKTTGTKRVYTRALGHFSRWAEAHSLPMLREIETRHIRQYLADYDGGWKRNTAQGRLVHLRVFFNYCADPERRWVPYAPTRSRDLNYAKKIGGGKRLPFTPQQVTQILAAAERMPEAVRDRARALILLLLFTGMRISDATFFERDYVTPNHYAEYYVIKTHRPISMPPELQEKALDALAKLPSSRVYFFQPDRADDYREARTALRDGQEFATLMPDYEFRVREVTNLVVKVLTLAGIKGSCHRFRDTFAVNLLTETDDIFCVSQMLGHSDVKITQEHYLKLVDGYRDRLCQKTRKLAYAFPEQAAA